MHRTRGEANQSCYRAKILIDAWERERDSAIYPERQVLGAFLPAVRMHLREAYGWFLLSISGCDQVLSPVLPASTRDLAPPEPGKAQVPEIGEFARLERTGWLGEMLAQEVGDTLREPSQQLLGSDRRSTGLLEAAQWVSALEAVMQRMDDSLIEH